MRADSPARGGGDTRWLAQNYTGRMRHTATKQDQLKLGSDKGLGRFLEARLVVSPKWFPRWWYDVDFGLDWALRGPFWRRARVRAGAVADGGRGSCPRAAGRVAASVFEVSSTDVQGARGRVSLISGDF